MKAIGTQIHEAGGSLLPPFASKSEAAAGDSFHAALAHAMLGAPAAGDGDVATTPVPAVTPIFEPRPIAVTLPIVVQPPVPMPIPVASSIPVAAPTPVMPVAPAPVPTLESRPIAVPVAVCAGPPAEPALVATAMQIALPSAAPAQAEKTSTAIEPKKNKTDGEPAEHAKEDPNAVRVPMPVMEGPVPAPSVPLTVPTGAEPQRLPRDGAGTSKTPLETKSRQPSQAPRPGDFQPRALDALLPQDRPVPAPAAPRSIPADDSPATGADAPPAGHKAMPPGVKVEALHVESAVSHPSAPRAPATLVVESKPSDAEPAIGPAGGTGAAGGGNVSSHGQRVAYDAPGSTGGPVEARHAEEPSRPPVPTDRVTLHLPDDAGGGRIQIAVRGDVVHARIVSADEAGTRELQAGTDELRSALTRQGFQETHVRVENGRVAADGWQRGAGAGAGAAAAGESAGGGEGRMHDSQSQDRRERHHGAPEDPRSDPRRQHHDGRSQQRARRERER